MEETLRGEKNTGKMSELEDCYLRKCIFFNTQTIITVNYEVKFKKEKKNSEGIFLSEIRNLTVETNKKKMKRTK